MNEHPEPSTEVDAPDLNPRDPAALCRELWDPLVGLLTLRTRNRAVAEELAQEALARAWADWPKVSAMQKPDRWVYRVALNLATSHVRRKMAERRARSRLESADTPPNIEPAEAIAVRDALGQLSRRQQEVVFLRYYVGMSVNETATTLGVREGTVKTQTHRGLKALGALLGTPLRVGDEGTSTSIDGTASTSREDDDD